MNLQVHEIFASLQGESTRAGQPCAFVRLAGCDVRCSYCDTPQAQDAAAGRAMTVAAVVGEVLGYGLPLVEITGGEPLQQRAGVVELAAQLLAAGQIVMLETSGCASVAGLDPRIEIIMDVKTPGSGAADKLCPENLPLLDGNDELKFVITGRDDYDWSRRFVATHDFSRLRAVHFSPAGETLPPATLAGWLRRDNPPVRFTMQLHKLLGIR